MILAIKTDQAQADLHLYQDGKLVDSYSWLAGRQLSDTLLQKITQLLKNNKVRLEDLKAIVVYQGPGSFTGLRIGISIANSMAYSLDIPVLASGGTEWVKEASSGLNADNYTIGAIPVYGAAANITKQRK